MLADGQNESTRLHRRSRSLASFAKSHKIRGAEEKAMRMEFRRMTGGLILEREWPVHGRPIEEIAAEAKDALQSCYEGDTFSFWPKREYAPDAPEEVRVVGLDGEVVVRYDLRNYLAETKRSLVARHST
jgi:hypothetical protein